MNSRNIEMKWQDSKSLGQVFFWKLLANSFAGNMFYYYKTKRQITWSICYSPHINSHSSQVLLMINIEYSAAEEN